MLESRRRAQRIPLSMVVYSFDLDAQDLLLPISNSSSDTGHGAVPWDFILRFGLWLPLG